jgi:DNA (cytosine-5)-methyltransferase 1
VRHPHTRHLTCDVFEADPKEVCKGRGVRILHASPDCTHFSVAKGGKPVSKRRRSLAWIVCRWAGTVRPEVITLENVYEIQSWGPLIAKRDKATGRVLRLDGTVAAKGERVPVEEQWLIPDPRHKGRIWRAWLKHLRGLGYSFEGKVLVCADYGVPTIRKRFFGVAKADGSPIVWRDRTHAPRKDAKRLGLRVWIGMHTCIDWSRPVKSIFGRAKDLAAATMRRTARGVVRHVVTAAKPFIVPITHSGDDRVHSIEDPARTFTTAHRAGRGAPCGDRRQAVHRADHAFRRRQSSFDRGSCAHVHDGAPRRDEPRRSAFRRHAQFARADLFRKRSRACLHGRRREPCAGRHDDRQDRPAQCCRSQRRP